MATTLVIPQTTLAVGQRQFRTTNFSAISNQWGITLNLISWPATGSVLTIAGDISQDNGNSFVNEFTDTLVAPSLDRHGLTVTTVAITVSYGGLIVPRITTLQFNLNVLQGCTISGSANAQ